MTLARALTMFLPRLGTALAAAALPLAATIVPEVRLQGRNLELQGDFGPRPRALRVTIDDFVVPEEHLQVLNESCVRLARQVPGLLPPAAGPTRQVQVEFLRRVPQGLEGDQPFIRQVLRLSDDPREAYLMGAHLGEGAQDLLVRVNGALLPPANLKWVAPTCVKVTLPAQDPGPLDPASLKVWCRDQGSAAVAADLFRRPAPLRSSGGEPGEARLQPPPSRARWVWAPSWPPAAGVPARVEVNARTRQFLLPWALEHLDHPFPEETEKEELIRRSGLSREQLENWFINFRQRHWDRSRAKGRPAPASRPAKRARTAPATQAAPKREGRQPKARKGQDVRPA